MIFSFNLSRFVYPVLWIFILFIFGGIEYILNINKQNWFLNINKWNLFFILGIITLSFMIFFTNIYIFKLINESFNFIIYLSYVIIIGLLFNFRLKNKINLFFISFVFLIFCALVGFSIHNTQLIMNNTKYDKAQFRLVGEWFEKNSKPGDKMLLTQPGVASYYANSSLDKNFVHLSSLTCDSPDPNCFISELKNKNITYIVRDNYYSDSNSDSRSYYYSKYKVYLLSILSDNDTKHFRLISKLGTGSQTALIYEFIT
jgi:hypothetical protein